jgi:phosphoglycolate phosphatase
MTPVLPAGGFRAVLFDLDGTLIDSAPDLAAAADALRTARGLPGLPFDRYRAVAGAGARGLIGVALGVQSEDPEFPALREAFFRLYEDRLTRATRAFDGVAALLQELRRRDIPWGIVTNKIARFTQPLLERIPELTGASVLVSGDTTPYTKPHPEPLLEAARRLQIEPGACVYVGDDERDILAGRAAGMRTVAACYGYLGDGGDPAGWAADAVIDSPTQLLKILQLA